MGDDVRLTLEQLGWDATWQSLAECADVFGGKSANLFVARVSIAHGGTYVVMSERGRERALLQGKLKRAVRMRLETKPVVGDWVVVGSSKHDGAVCIHSILPRRSKFSRAKAGGGEQTFEQIVSANLDTVFILTSMNSEFSVRRLERYITQARVGGVEPVLVLTKKDICPPEWIDEFMNEAQSVVQGTAVAMTSAVTGEGIDNLRKYFLPNRTVSLLGSSGVGKSTLVNILLGHERQNVSEIRDDDKGRHTTSHREMLLLAGGGLIIDNPGMRELRLFGADEETIAETFEEIEELAKGCKFTNCKHLSEPDCAVKAAVLADELDEERLDAWRSLANSD